MNTVQYQSSIITGDQEKSQRDAAQHALKQLQAVISQGGNQGAEPIRDALLKAEEILNREARSPNLDPKIKKTLEDLVLLVGSAKQLEQQKDLGERLQKIAEETKKALDEISLPGVSAQSKETTQQAILFVQKIRPVFQLLISSREFRVLLLDSVEILRRIFLRHGREPGETAKHQFIEGEDPMNIAKEAAQNSADSFQDHQGEVKVQISEGEWNDLKEDITRVLATVARQPSYQQGVETLLDLVDIVREQARQTAAQTANTVQGETHSHRAQAETKDLIAAFSGREALDAFLDSLNHVVRKIDQDERSRKFLTEIRKLLLSTKSAEYVQQEEFKQRTSNLANEARDIANEYQYADEVEEFLNRSEDLMRNIRNDEYVEVIRQHAGLVVDDLSFVDNSGKVQLDMDMLGRLRNVLGPILAESLKYIPIPRIESSDKYRDYWVDNIVLCGYDVLPDHIRVQLESDSDVSIRDIETKHSYTKLIVTLGQIRTELKDLDFYYKRKSFPEIVDSGRMNVRLGGPNGATLKLTFRVEQTPSDKLPKFQEGSASFDIEKFDITFDKNTINHSILLPLISSLFKAQIQSLIESSVEDRLGGLLDSLADQLTQALSSVNRPLISGLEQLRKVGKSNEFAQTYEKRQEKLE
jgi:hypothetical protein